jgi:transketolase
MRQAALNSVYELAKKDSRIVFIGSDLGAGTLKEMKENLPKQFFMEGISEQHLIGFAAGLAKEGFIPYVNTIANFFTRRAFDQIAMNAALHDLPIKLLASGGGMVYAPLGPTHTAIEDFSLMSSIPGLRIFAPGDANEMSALIRKSPSDPRPWYVRFGKGGEPVFSPKAQETPEAPKKYGHPKGEFLILTTGILIHESLAAIEILSNDDDPSVTAIHFPELSNLNESMWYELFQDARIVIVAEEHIPNGGLLSKVLKIAWQEKWDTRKLIHRSLPFRYLHNYGSQKDHLREHGLDAIGLVECIRAN